MDRIKFKKENNMKANNPHDCCGILTFLFLYKTAFKF